RRPRSKPILPGKENPMRHGSRALAASISSILILPMFLISPLLSQEAPGESALTEAIRALRKERAAPAREPVEGASTTAEPKAVPAPPKEGSAREEKETQARAEVALDDAGNKLRLLRERISELNASGDEILNERL